MHCILIIESRLKMILEPSYNQPRFSANATWYPNAINFANMSVIGASPRGIFVNINDTIYVTNRANNSILIWTNNSLIPTKTISKNLSNASSIFVTITGDIYVDVNRRVDKWPSNANVSVTVMNVSSICRGLFVDVTNTLYCSMPNHHQVVKRWLNDISILSTIVAGTGTAGNNSFMLNSPHGIFVDTNLDLYVVDTMNNRIQLFSLGQSNGITVAGNRSLNVTITLNSPTFIALDADRYLFIADSGNNRIIGSGPYGFRCIVGCSGSNSSSQLQNPSAFSFDSIGNIYVVDEGNSRIQKFLLSDSSGNITKSSLS